MKKLLHPLLLAFLMAGKMLFADVQQLSVQTMDEPYPVTLGLDRVTAFVFPSAVQSTRIAPHYLKEKFIFESDEGTNVLYVSPKTVPPVPVTVFAVADNVPYEFSITVTREHSYRHQVIIGKSPIEIAVDKAVFDLRSEIETLRTEKIKEREDWTRRISGLLSGLTREGKLKVVQKNKTVFTDGKLFIKWRAEIGKNLYLLETNIPAPAFGLGDAVFLNNQILTGSRKFKVLNKEVEL